MTIRRELVALQQVGVVLILTIAGCTGGGDAVSMNMATPKTMPVVNERHMQMSRDAEARGLAEPLTAGMCNCLYLVACSTRGWYSDFRLGFTS
jgi:hypothetical protein